jgi:CDP-diacylglycerol--serine O-phosphatidyltransferase
MIRNKIYLIPNMLTIGSLFCGFLSLIYIFNNNFYQAAILIIVATFLDSLDGRIARITKTTSEFGAQLDSLSDIVTSGLAPAVLLYSWFLNEVDIFNYSLINLGLIISFIYLSSVALRLARFNSSSKSDFFIGLPCPIPAAFFSLFFILFESINIDIIFYINEASLVVLLLSFLMISKFSYLSFKSVGSSEKIKFYWLFAFIVLFTLIMINPLLVASFLISVYILSGPVVFIIRHLSKIIFNKQKSESKQ